MSDRRLSSLQQLLVGLILGAGYGLISRLLFAPMSHGGKASAFYAVMS